MEIQKVLTHLVRAGRDALHLDNTLNELGYKETPYFSLYGEITEAMYCLLEESVDTFKESETCNAMEDIYTSDELCAERLASMFKGGSGIDLPETTREVLAEAAERRGMELDRFIRLILCEWAAREMMLNSLHI